MSEEEKKPKAAPQEAQLVEDDDLFEDFAEDGGFGLRRVAGRGTVCQSARRAVNPHTWRTQAPALAEEPEAAKDTKLPLWTADWDDEDAGQDFAQRLKAELQKGGHAPKQGAPAKMDTS